MLLKSVVAGGPNFLERIKRRASAWSRLLASAGLSVWSGQHGCLFDPGGLGQVAGRPNFSPVSTPIFASKFSLEISWRDLQDRSELKNWDIRIIFRYHFHNFIDFRWFFQIHKFCKCRWNPIQIAFFMNYRRNFHRICRNCGESQIISGSQCISRNF